MAYFEQNFFDRFLVSRDCIEFRKNKIKLSSGRYSNLYINIGKLMDNIINFNELMWYVKNFVYDKKLKPDYFLGVPDGMTKLGVIMTYTKAENDLRFDYDSYVSEGYSKDYSFPIARKKIKKHGSEKGERFLGNLKGKIVILEDVLTTGGSVIDLIEDLKETGAEILAVLGLIDRLELRKDKLSVAEKLSELNIDYHCMTDVKTLLPLACKKLKPTKDLVKKINLYYKKYGCTGINI